MQVASGVLGDGEDGLIGSLVLSSMVVGFGCVDGVLVSGRFWMNQIVRAMSMSMAKRMETVCEQKGHRAHWSFSGGGGELCIPVNFVLLW